MNEIKEMRDIKMVLLDMDGTLLNSGNQIYVGIKYIIEHYRDEAPLFLEVWEKYEPSLLDYLAQFGVTEDDHEDVEALFYEAMDFSSVTLFPDVAPVLKELRARNIVTGVISSNVTEHVRADCAKGGIVELLDFIRGSLSCKAKAIEVVCKEKGIEPSEVAYVGDMAFDVHHSNRAGAIAVAITRHHGTRGMFKKIGAHYCIEGLNGLFTCGLLSTEYTRPGYELLVGSYAKKGGGTGKRVTLFEIRDDGSKEMCYEGRCGTGDKIRKTLPINLSTHIPIKNGTTFFPK